MKQSILQSVKSVQKQVLICLCAHFRCFCCNGCPTDLGKRTDKRFGLKGQGTSLPPSPCTTRRGGASVGGGMALSRGGRGKPKVSLSLNHGLLQYYFASFSKAAK